MAFIEPMHRNKPNITYLFLYVADPQLQLDAAKPSSILQLRQLINWSQGC